MIEKEIFDKNFVDDVYNRYLNAIEKRSVWESYWEECYEYALPQKSGTFNGENFSNVKKNTNVFDSTAESAVDRLASSLLSQLTPPWSKWKISTRLIQRFLKQSTKKVKRFFFWQLISHQKTKKNAVKTTY